MIALRKYVVFAVLAALQGCVANEAFRGAVSDEPCRVDPVATFEERCAQANIERHPNFDLAFVEFDDQGWFYKRKQLESAIAHLERVAAQDASQEILVLVFVHGWKHNAGFNDQNVEGFRKNILPRFTDESRRRRLVGLYVGWRGASLDLPHALQSVTFYDRKYSAEHVARGSVRELFERVRQFEKTANAAGKRRVRLMIVGHSFGGLIVYNALAGHLRSEERRVGKECRL